MASAEHHAASTFPATCLGEKCPNYQGSPCNSSFFEWIGAKATVMEGRDLKQPPLQSEAIYVTYGQVCVEGSGFRGLRYRIHDYGRERFTHTETGLVIHADSAFGDGIDVDVFDVKVGDDGSNVEELKTTYDGWGPGGLNKQAEV